ncbi:MAG: hypothetical protein AVDCRST_MAG40-2751, partial [uncultured Gemmatimonadaceae bacterium]
ATARCRVDGRRYGRARGRPAHLHPPRAARARVRPRGRCHLAARRARGRAAARRGRGAAAAAGPAAV